VTQKAQLDQGQCRLGQGLYRYRHLVENAFARKHYRAVAFPYDKLKRNYESMVAILPVPVATYVKRQQTLAELQASLIFQSRR